MTTALTPAPAATAIQQAAIAELCNVTKTYAVAGGRELKVLDQIDLAIHEGELLALLGQRQQQLIRVDHIENMKIGPLLRTTEHGDLALVDGVVGEDVD